MKTEKFCSFESPLRNRSTEAAASPAQTPQESIDESHPYTSDLTARGLKQAQESEMPHTTKVNRILHTLDALVASNQVKMRISITNVYSSKKNETASAAATPVQTPRNSMHEQRPKVMTQDEALHMIFQKTMTNAATGPFLR
ncbi:hypothetical protein EDD21DRAFT_416088 [Dissophora ornata]|nr:hypothetical protein EDD21DRAFT_416088 [Dissophora ornata]